MHLKKTCICSKNKHAYCHNPNDEIKRALQKAGLPSVLEPPGLDGSRPDGITVFPFSGGRSLVWDCTCVDAFAGVHLNRSAMEAGLVEVTGEPREVNWFRQNLAIAIQRGNAFSILSGARERARAHWAHCLTTGDRVFVAGILNFIPV